MWPEDYYRELDGALRKELLDKEIDSCGGKIPEEDRLRLELWEARYGGADAGVDYFMKGWTDLSLIAKKEPAAGGRSGFRQAARALMLERFSRERGIYTDLFISICMITDLRTMCWGSERSARMICRRRSRSALSG